MVLDGLVPFPICTCDCGCEEMLSSDEEADDGICVDCQNGDCVPEGGL